jgi:hypothetical protein
MGAYNIGPGPDSIGIQPLIMSIPPSHHSPFSLQTLLITCSITCPQPSSTSHYETIVCEVDASIIPLIANTLGIYVQSHLACIEKAHSCHKPGSVDLIIGGDARKGFL